MKQTPWKSHRPDLRLTVRFITLTGPQI